MHWKWLEKVEAWRPFSEDDAWGLYRIIALAEAGGWTLLIIGILVQHFSWPGKTVAVPITGQIHGTIFLAYFGILLTIYSSLRWSRRKFLVAILAGVPPYGTLVFEQWAERNRRNRLSRQHFRSIMLARITDLAR